jgi:cytochrome c553
LRHQSSFGWAITLATCATAALADPVPDHSTAPQIPACQACHGRAGISIAATIPNLAGQKKAYLVAQLQAFRAGSRKNDLMSAIAAQLSDAEIDALAGYWSLQPRAGGDDGAPSAAAVPTHMQLPPKFPEGFVRYQVHADAAQGHVARRYANQAALKAVRDGKPLPVGAVLVTATHALSLDASGKPLLDARSQPIAGALQSYAGMEVGAGWGAAVPAVLRNGDWNYALFGPDGKRRDNANHAACLACHKPMASDSHVFTMKALRDFAKGE